MMNRMFEPVLFDRRKIPWDYRIYTDIILKVTIIGINAAKFSLFMKAKGT